MSTGFSTILQPIDLDIAWKGQVDLLLAEDSILAGVFSLISSLFFFILSCRHGYIEPWLFLVSGFLHYKESGDLRFRIKTHSDLIAITLEISSRSSIGSTNSSNPHDKMKFLVSSAFFFTLS